MISILILCDYRTMICRKELSEVFNTKILLLPYCVMNKFSYQLMKMHAMTSAGYVVVNIDNSGSYNREIDFEAHIQNKMVMCVCMCVYPLVCANRVMLR